MSARDISTPIASRPRKPACTVWFAGTSTGAKILGHGPVQVRGRHDLRDALHLAQRPGDEQPDRDGEQAVEESGAVARVGDADGREGDEAPDAGVVHRGDDAPGAVGQRGAAQERVDRRPECADHRVGPVDRLADRGLVVELRGHHVRGGRTTPSFCGDRTNAVTSCPSSSRRLTASSPILPVAPNTVTFTGGSPRLSCGGPRGWAAEHLLTSRRDRYHPARDAVGGPGTRPARGAGLRMITPVTGPEGRGCPLRCSTAPPTHWITGSPSSSPGDAHRRWPARSCAAARRCGPGPAVASTGPCRRPTRSTGSARSPRPSSPSLVMRLRDEGRLRPRRSARAARPRRAGRPTRPSRSCSPTPPGSPPRPRRRGGSAPTAPSARPRDASSPAAAAAPPAGATTTPTSGSALLGELVGPAARARRGARRCRRRS